MEKEQFTAKVSDNGDGFTAIVTQNSNNEIVFQQKFKDPNVAWQVATREMDLLQNK